MTTAVDNKRNAWVRGGVAVNATSASDAMREAGLDWTVSMHDMFAFSKENVLPVDKRQAVVKTDGDEESVIGVVGSKYKLVQNQEVFSAVDSLVDSGAARYTAAGEYDGGAKVWMIMSLPDGINIANDPHAGHLLVKTSHDGSSSVIIKPIIERIFCANQINRLIGAKKLNKYTYTMKHTTNAALSISDIRNITQLTYDFIDEYSAVANNLLHRSADKQSAQRIFEKVWALPPEVATVPYDLLTQGQRRQFTIATEARASALEIYENSPTQENIKGTAFGVWQAVVEYADHYAKGGSDKRAIATLSGSNDRLKSKALDLVLTA